MQYLPSKRFFIVIVSLAVITGVGYGFTAWRKNVRAEKNRLALEKIEKFAISNANTDSDGDSLLDWEESKLGTNSKKADTDADGTPDGVEISLGRDPLVKGPNDYMNYTSIKNSSTTPTISSLEDLTLTEKMMREMLTVAGRDTQDDPDFPKTVAKNIMEDFNKKAGELPAVFKLRDINTVTETSASLKQYGNDLGVTFKKFGNQNDEQQKILYMVLVSLKTRDSASFETLPKLISARKDQISAVSKLKVPEYLAPIHLNLLNQLSDTVIAIENIGYMVSDPARGLIGMQQYKSTMTKMKITLDSVTTHFDNSGISFTATENASLLYNAFPAAQ
ncbi:MAG: hypothetical protein WCT49_00210 [Candidatus Paceibacterota bacterium]|jgi:hypothetical protein|nr:hypothetical protein [Candidatus Paceibacterota bacterium]